MWCSSCGNQIAEGMSACPICGALTGAAGQKPQEGVPEQPQEIIPGQMFTVDPRYVPAPQKETKEDSRAFKRSLGLAGIGTVISVIALFLPFLNFSFLSSFTESLSLMEGKLRNDGMILMAILVGGFLLVAVGKKSKGIRNIVVGAIVCVVGLIDLTNNMKIADGSFVKITPGIGFFLLMIGGVIIVASGVMRMMKSLRDDMK